jgi:rod shape determining protein RodA
LASDPAGALYSADHARTVDCRPAQTTFGRVMAGGLMLILFVYVFVNIGMVSGILPVVGVPLPLVSYGGSALIVLMAGFGIVMSIHTHRKMLSKSV